MIVVQLSIGGGLFAQTRYSIDENADYYYRLLQITGETTDNLSFTIRPMEPVLNYPLKHVWKEFVDYNKSSQRINHTNVEFQFYDPMWFQSVNSSLPRGLNDGAIWQGRGYNSMFSFGVKANYGPIHIKFKPLFGFTQNSAFDLGPYPITQNNEYAYRIRPQIDYVQRFGNKSKFWVDLGDSYLEIRYRGLHSGISNTRLWAGPATLFPLLFSYQGPGFLHGFLGSYRPIKTPIGHFEFRYLYGGLRKSDYFTSRSGSNLTSINTIIVSYSPAFAKGLSIGGQRMYMEAFPDDIKELRRQISKIYNPVVREGLQTDENPTGWEPDNQMITIFGRWYFPKSNFELYIEFGRNDHNADWRDLRMQPDHMRAYLFGFIKVYEIRNQKLLAINYEVTQTEPTRSSYTRGLNNTPPKYDDLGYLGSWYTHQYQTVGFTNKGQMIGSGFGPGGNAQSVKIDYYSPEGKYGARLSRLVYNNSLIDNVSRGRNYYEIIIAENPGIEERWRLRNTEFVLSLDATRMWKYGLEVSATIEQSYILNQHFLAGNDAFNTRLELTLRKRLPGGLR